MPASAQPWSRAEEQSLTKLVYSINQRSLNSYASQDSSQRLTRTHAVQPRSRSSPNPDVWAFFKRQEKRETGFTASQDKKEKTESFLTALSTSGKISASMADPKNLEISRLRVTKKASQGTLTYTTSPLFPRTLKTNQRPRASSSFGASLLYTVSESLRQEAAVPGNSYSERASFNRKAKVATDNDSPTLPHPTPLPLLESDQQVWLQTLPQSQTKPDSPAKSEAQQTQPLIQVLPPAPQSQFRI